MKDYYVLLTGGKNNAGDYLIKHRAIKLLDALRPDRDIVDFNAWETIDDNKLEIINRARGLLLTGGPSLQSNMYNGIYKLTSNLDNIKVPIITFGIGWKSSSGNWDDIYTYKFNEGSRQLIKRIAESGHINSVRDYHTMHVLQEYGVKNVVMTGCPALYDLPSIGKSISMSDINNISFSLGVVFATSKSMERSVKNIILELKDQFPGKQISVKFHHSINKQFLKTPDANSKLFNSNLSFVNWLSSLDMSYEDISGSAENLIKCYLNSDLHIGYRVHAHIFMSSISKPSILIAEDGRGIGLEAVLGGIVLPGYTERKNTVIHKAISKITPSYDRYLVNNKLPELLVNSLQSELAHGYPRLKVVRNNIDNHFDIMVKYIKELP